MAMATSEFRPGCGSNVLPYGAFRPRPRHAHTMGTQAPFVWCFRPPGADFLPFHPAS